MGPSLPSVRPAAIGGWLGVCLAVTGCGGASTERVGVTDQDPRPQPVELELRTPEGVPLHVGDLRGEPVLLYFFATFDGMSQAALRPLSRFVRHHPEVHVVGIALQPDAEALLDAWAHALDPPFVVAYDPRGRVSEGTSDLGVVDQIPTFVLLDPEGYEIDRHVGFASQNKLDRMLYAAGRRASPQPDADELPPLMAD